MSPEQISGRKSSRSADHLTVVRFLIEKYAICFWFFYLRKAFDTVERMTIFYTLLSKYKIGGQFLNLLKEMN